jgi:hypothetical protein
MILAQIGTEVGDFFAQPFITSALTAICFLGLLLILVVALLIYLRNRGVGVLSSLGSLRSRQPSTNADVDMPELDALVSAPVESAPPRALRKGTFTVTPADAEPTEVVEVLTVMRDVVDGRLLVQIGEKTLVNAAQDAAFYDRLQKILRELGGPRMVVSTGTFPTAPSSPPAPVAPAAPQSPPPPVPAPDPAEDEPLPLPDSLLPPTPPPRPAPYSTRPPVNAPGVLPSFKLDDMPLEKPQRGKKYQPKPVPELNLAGAIESFIQFKIANLGLFPARSIHIHPAPDGGVAIEVDGQFYDAVGDIDEVAVREFLAASIQEWQDQH